MPANDETQRIDPPDDDKTIRFNPDETQRASGWRHSGSDPTQRIPIDPTQPIRSPESGWRDRAPAPPPPQPYPKPEKVRPAPPAVKPRPAPSPRAPASFWLLFLRAFFVMAILTAVAFACVISTSVAGYFYLAAQLPSPEDMAQQATQLFTSSQIYDKDGNLLFELLDPQGGRRTVIKLDQMSEWVRKAVVDTEDPRFYRHPGFDAIGIARAVIQSLREGEVVSGASTIAQQLVRNLLLPEGAERTANRKIREIVLAAEVTRRYPRDTILELYLNSVYFGNLAYGVEAAAQTYFGKSARDLTLAEGSFVAGLVQSPAVYDPLTPDGREAALNRHRVVLRLMVEAGDITQAQAGAAAAEIAAFEFKPPRITVDIPAPHFVQYVRQIVEAEFGPEALYRGGLKIYTTLDPRLQSIAEDVVRDQIARLADRHVTDSALIALEPSTGRVRAMVGSPDYNNVDIAGQINMATTPRQTGSAIKPLTYLAAFEQGWTPATGIWDTPVKYVDTAGNVYEPRNYDGKWHGPQSARSALANSYNIPAVKTLAFVGVPEFLNVARRFGITTFTRPDYGLALTLGGGEAPLIEMVGAFQIFANGGQRMPPIVIERITDVQGVVQCQFGQAAREVGIPPCESVTGAGEQVISPPHAYLITSILSDNLARCPAFGCPNILEIGRPTAVKTGTTNDYRDNWTIGYTPDLVAGVWVGNADRSEMKNVSGVTGAGPIWSTFMQRALEGKPALDFSRPPGLIEMEVCAYSGTQPSEHCPDRRREIFVATQPPPGPEHDWVRAVQIDPASGLLWQAGCAGPIEKVLAVVPEEGREWAQQRGLEVAPTQLCTPGSTVAGIVSIGNPPDAGFVNGVVPIIGTVQIVDFEHYDVTYAPSWSPAEWKWISGPHLSPVSDSVLTTWDTNSLEEGEYTLRVTAYTTGGDTVEGFARVIVKRDVVPTPTSEPTPEPIGPTDTPTPGPTETLVILPTLPPSTETPAP